jgi:multimeric flavodoxin WrbA
MKVLIINGSHRAGNTDIIVEKVRQQIMAKCDVRVLVLREVEMKLPDGCEACAKAEICPNTDDTFSRQIEPSIRNFDVYIIASPTYSDSVTPLTKIFWDRIVSWCHESRMYLKGKKLAVITHGMEDIGHLDGVVNWVRGICRWEEAKFGGALIFSSGSRPGELDVKDEEVEIFVQELLK